MNRRDNHNNGKKATKPALPPKAERPATRRRSAWRTAGRAVLFSIKILAIPVLCIAALMFGLAVGYSVLGGREVEEAFDWRTWKHMWDLVFAE